MDFHPKRNEQLWRLDLQTFLNNHECEVVFQKADGSIRYMKCTLQPNLVPETNSAREKSSERLTVFDTEVKGWRTIKFDRIISYTVQNEYVRALE